jgi:hypothetical protein
MSANVGDATPQLSNSCTSYAAHQVHAGVRSLRQHDVERDVEVAVLHRREQVPLRRVGRRVHQHAGAGLRLKREGRSGPPWRRRRHASWPRWAERSEIGSGIDCARQQAGRRIRRLRRVRRLGEAVVSAVADNSAARQTI